VARLRVLNRPALAGGDPAQPAEVEAGPALSLLNALLREGVRIRHDCGGKALCGTCRLRVRTGAGGLSPAGPREAARLAALAAAGEDVAGQRLACQAHAMRDIEIEAVLD
jgi:ferredoxin